MAVIEDLSGGTPPEGAGPDCAGPDCPGSAGALGTAELAGAPPEELTDALVQLSALENVTRLQLLRMVLAISRSGCWAADGSASPGAWLAWRLRISTAEGATLARVAEALDRLPEITAAFGSGRISWEQVVIASRFATPDTDASLAEALPGWSINATLRAARAARDKSEAEARAEHRSRYCRFRWNTRTETFELHARLADTAGAVLSRVLHYLAAGAAPDPDTGEYEAFEVRCADALAELASRRLGACADADRATVVLHAEVDATRGISAGIIDDGAPVCVQTVRRLLCDCQVELSVEDFSTGEVVGVGRRTRVWPRWAYRLIRHRDGGCVFPGCERRAWIHVHHITHWTNGGPTDLANGTCLCPTHHHLVHEGGWDLTGNPETGVLVFTAPDGRAFPAQRMPLRAEVACRVGIDWNLTDPPWWPYREDLDHHAEPWDVPIPEGAGEDLIPEGDGEEPGPGPRPVDP